MSIRKKYTNKDKTNYCWEFVVDIPSGKYDIKGNPIRKQKRVSGFKKEKDAKDAERKFLENLNNGKIELNTASTFNELASVFLTYIEKSPNYQKGTISNYKGYYNNHMNVFHNMKIKNITQDIISEWVLQEQINGTSPYVINGCRKFARAVFSYSKNKVTINPFADMEKISEPVVLRERLSIEELRKMQEVCYNNIPEFYCIFCLSYSTGMRLGEYTAINKEDIKFNLNKIYINKQFTRGELKNRTKTSKSTRIVDYPEGLNNIFKWHIKKYGIFSGLMFKGKNPENPVSAKWVNKQFKKLLKLCGYPENYMRVHDLRGQYVDIMHKVGAPTVVISREVGHARTSTTDDIYTSILKEVNSDVMNQLNNVIF